MVIMFAQYASDPEFESGPSHALLGRSHFFTHEQSFVLFSAFLIASRCFFNFFVCDVFCRACAYFNHAL